MTKNNPFAALFGEPEPTNPLADHVFPGTFAGFETYDQGHGDVIALLTKLADRVVTYGPRLLADENPFPEGKILSIWSPPGRGKSHLMQGFINHIKANDPRVLTRVAMSSPAFNTGGFDPERTPILLLDDLFAHNSDAVAVSQLPEAAVHSFKRLATMIWEQKVFAFITCNYEVLGPMFERLRALDMVGRSTSRLNQLLAASKEIRLGGKDYRAELATRRRAEQGDVFDL